MPSFRDTFIEVLKNMDSLERIYKQQLAVGEENPENSPEYQRKLKTLYTRIRNCYGCPPNVIFEDNSTHTEVKKQEAPKRKPRRKSETKENV